MKQISENKTIKNIVIGREKLSSYPMWYSFSSTVHQSFSHGAHSLKKKTTFLRHWCHKNQFLLLHFNFHTLRQVLPNSFCWFFLLPLFYFHYLLFLIFESLGLRNSERFCRSPFLHRFAAIWLVRIRWVASSWKTPILTQCMWRWETTRRRRNNCCIGRLIISLARMFVFFIFTDLTPSIRSVSFSSITPFKQKI